MQEKINSWLLMQKHVFINLPAGQCSQKEEGCAQNSNC